MVKKIKVVKSRNFHSRGGAEINKIVLHYTADGPGSAVSYFKNYRRASAHYVIERDGQIIRMVDHKYAAWHAGYKPRDEYERDRLAIVKPNESSIGIEIVNWGMVDHNFKTWTGKVLPDDEVVLVDGKFWQKYTEPQYVALKWLVKKLCDELIIPRDFMFAGQAGFQWRDKDYPKVPYYMPCGLRCDTKRFREGICGHCHISKSKPDPGPHLQWDKFL